MVARRSSARGRSGSPGRIASSAARASRRRPLLYHALARANDTSEADGTGKTKYLGFLEIDKQSESGGSKTVAVTDGWLLIDMKATGFPTTSYSYTIEVDKTN